MTVVVLTGANGFVGSHVCAALVARGATVRAVVRRSGSAPASDHVEEVVGDFTDPDVAAAVVVGADAVVTTVYPMGDGSLATQRRISVDGTVALCRAAAAAGVPRLVHVSTAGVYDRAPGVGDVDESSALVEDDAGDYAVTKRDTDIALAEIEGITRVLVRPPAILGPGASSVWNSVRPVAIRDQEPARHAQPDKSFAWVHVRDLASFTAEVATGRVATAEDPDVGPVVGACTPVNLAAGPATTRDYHETVTGALGVTPTWDEGPAWTGQIRAGRAARWGWRPEVDRAEALTELAAGLRG